ncbi:MAG: carboxymuconolactone decarboxylase family protein [Pseudomonadota bacterium]
MNDKSATDHDAQTPVTPDDVQAGEGAVAALAPLAARGLEVRRDVLGSAYADGSMARAQGDAVAQDHQTLVNAYIWGAVWSREGLARKQRSTATITILALRGQTAELKLHLNAALKNGYTKPELQELFMHIGAYAGVPIANYGLQLIDEMP